MPPCELGDRAVDLLASPSLDGASQRVADGARQQRASVPAPEIDLRIWYQTESVRWERQRRRDKTSTFKISARRLWDHKAMLPQRLQWRWRSCLLPGATTVRALRTEHRPRVSGPPVLSRPP